jgi:type I restriction enzyme, S subunit
MTPIPQTQLNKIEDIPAAWNIVKFHEVVEETQLGTGDRGNCEKGNIPLLKMGNLQWGYFDLSRSEQIGEEKISNSMLLQDGDLLFNNRNTPDLVGKTSVWHEELNKATYDNNILRIRLKKEADPDFVCYQMTFGKGKSRLRSIAAGSTSVAAIYWKDLANYALILPPNNEQEAIVRTIQKWNRAIEIIKYLIASKLDLRKGIMHQLLSEKWRFPGFSEPWRAILLGDATKEYKVRNKGLLTVEAVRAVNKTHGMIPMKEHVIANDLSKYKVVKHGCFAYNPMRINIGSICLYDEEPEILVSPDYVVFHCLDNVLDYRYLNYLRQTHLWEHYVKVAGSGGVRVRIYYSELARLRLTLPTLKEQQKIIQVLSAIDNEINLLMQYSAALTEQKKGLMQQLLTGNIRVNISGAESN